ncbi:MAG: ATP-binding protein [Burkholderiales bacterium]
MNEILKDSGWRDATPPASGAGPRVAEPVLDDSDDDACARCAGAGFVRRAVRLGHPDFGKAFPCQCTQDEREDQRQARLLRYSNLGPLSRLTFDNLSPRGRSPNPQHQERFADALRSARSFAQAPSGWIVFSGPSGCGKTHLAAAIAGFRIDSGEVALFMVVPDLLDHLRAAYQPDSQTGYDDLFELLRSAPLLILDDLGVQSATAWAEEKLFQLINHRYSAQLPNVFTTNLPLDSFDARVQSRLTDAALAQVHYLEPGPASGASGLDALNLSLLREMTFKSFDPRRPAADAEETRRIQAAYREAMKFAQEPRDWLVIAGGTGRGKTRLAAAIGNYCREAGTGVMFVVVPDLLDRLRSSYDPQNAKAFDDLFEQVRNAPLLILDDLGAQSVTAWAEEKLFQLINYRYNACLPTVITTNLTVRSIEARLASRLTDPQVSTILLMGHFDFWGKESPAGAAPSRPRGRPRRS